MAEVYIRNFTRGPVPRLPFQKMAQSVLPGWEISLVIAGKARAQKLNQELRSKSYVPNVLSYEVGNKSGEIILCPEVSKAEAPLFDHKPNEHLLYLFIHGLLHLKGLPHGDTMEKLERTLLRKGMTFSSHSNGTTHRNRY